MDKCTSTALSLSAIAAKKVRRKHKLSSVAPSNRVRSREQTAENASTVEGSTCNEQVVVNKLKMPSA